MAESWASIDIAAPPVQVWQLVGGFGSLHDWLPTIATSELADGGRVRKLTSASGDLIVERLLTYDAHSYTYSYAIDTSPFPVLDYTATLRVDKTPGGDGARVQWSAQFTADGVADADLCQQFDSMFEDGLSALALRFDPDAE